MQKHRIYQELVELKIDSDLSSSAVQERVGRVLQQSLLPKLDQLFSKMTKPDELFVIDQLEIDLGTIAVEELEKEFLTIVLEKIEKVLHQKRSELNQKVTGNTLLTTSEMKNKKEFLQKTDQTILELFFYFLETGAVQWWTTKMTLEEVEQNVQKAIQTNKKKFEQSFLYVLKNEKAVERLVYQCSDQFLDFLLELKQPLRKKILTAKELTFIQKVKQSKSDWTRISDVLKKMILRSIYFEDQNAALFFKYWEKHLDEQIEKFQGFEHEQDFIASLKVLNNPLTKEGLQKSKKEKAKFEEKKKTRIDKIGETKQEKITPSTGKEMKHKLSTEKDNLKEEEQLLIGNAGLVLIAPFLSTFFAKLGLVEENNFVDKKASHYAVHLLDFIATGKEQQAEYDQTLNKILCGIPLNEPIKRSIVLSAESKKEAIVLLESVIEYWKALRNTSPDALRETFLQREGILVKKHKLVELNITEKTLDILLAQLPWGISMIKLPWMDDMLKVKWVN